MKSSAGKLPASAVLLLALAPLAAFAQNIASQPGTVNRSLDRLTLLPGPTLLSPARGAGLPAPTVRVDATAFRFSQTTKTVRSLNVDQSLIRVGTGTLTLSSAKTQPSSSLPLSTDAAPLHPDTLRFEFTLHLAPPMLRLDPRPPLTRD